MMAPVCCPETYRSVTPWGDGAAFGLDVSRFSRQLLNDLHAVVWDAGVLLAEPTEIGWVHPLALDEFALDTSVSWQAERAGELHGLGLWIDVELADGLTFSNAPSGRSTGWDQRLLPLAQPISIQAGAVIEVHVRTLGPSPLEPEWWSWRVQAGGEAQEMDTFRGLPLSLAQLRRACLDNRPVLSPRGRLRHAALGLMDGRHSVAEIARQLRERFPDLVSNDAEAYRLVAREVDRNEGPAATQAPEDPAETSR
jgi:protein arginine N-methyltransferase 1